MKGLSQLMVSEISGHGHLALSLWACGGTEHLGRGLWWRRSALLIVAGKRRKRGRGHGPSIPFRGSRDLTSSREGILPLPVPLSPLPVLSLKGSSTSQ